jgi:hypothetical protein
VKELEVGLKISSRYGAAIHYLTSSWEGLSPDLAPGLHWFEVRMARVVLFPGTYVIGAWVSKPREWSDVNAQEITSIFVRKADVTGYPTRMEEYVFSGGEVYTPSEWRLLTAKAGGEIYACTKTDLLPRVASKAQCVE